MFFFVLPAAKCGFLEVKSCGSFASKSGLASTSTNEGVEQNAHPEDRMVI